MIRKWVALHRGTIFHWSMEVVIVVIGILIAFALQGWAQDAGDRRRAAEAERRIRVEMFGNADRLVERITIHPCLRAKVAELSAALVAGDPKWRPTLSSFGRRESFLEPVYPVPIRGWPADVYRSALGSGDLANIGAERSALMAKLYNSVAQLESLNAEENKLADALQPLQLIDRPSVQERHAMLATVARLDAINGLARLVAVQYLTQLRLEGFRLEPSEIDRYRTATWPEYLQYDRKRYGACVDARAIDVFEPAIRAGTGRPAAVR